MARCAMIEFQLPSASNSTSLKQNMLQLMRCNVLRHDINHSQPQPFAPKRPFAGLSKSAQEDCAPRRVIARAWRTLRLC